MRRCPPVANLRSASGIGLKFGLALGLGFLMIPLMAQAQPSVEQDVIRQADHAENSREASLIGYTVTEHYFIRNSRLSEPEDATVKVTYNVGTGKTYEIVNRSGPMLLNKVFDSLLDNEKKVSSGPNRKAALVTSDNYDMKLAGKETIGDRECEVLAITPKQVSEFLLQGRIWVDATTKLLVRIDGMAGASPSFLAGRPTITRDYGQQKGFALATHSHAVSSSFLSGSTTVDIDYIDYDVNP